MLQLGNTVPNFTQQSSQGELDFYDWPGDNWVVFFSHPADYTPVCTIVMNKLIGVLGISILFCS